MNAWRLVVAPMAALAFCIVAVLVAVKRPVPRPPPPRSLTPSTVGAFLRYLVQLAVGGYVCLLAIVLVFGVLVVGDRRALPDAALSAPLLIGIALPAFALLTWLEGRLRGG